MLILMRRRDNKEEKTHMIEPEEIVAAAWADSTACYKGRKPGFRILCRPI
jgi:hypothetical protein